jgi:hypothetical protein
MSEHAPVAAKSADDPAFKLPESLSKLSIPLSIGGVIALLLGWGLGNYHGGRFAMSVYLTSFIYCLTISIGCLFFVVIQHLCRAGWSVVVRRIAELIMMMVFPLAILFLPILITLWYGNGTLYHWDNVPVVSADGVVESVGFAGENHISDKVWTMKSMFLNERWFFIRALIYFSVWCSLAYYYFRGSTRQDETGDKAITDQMQFWSGPALMLLALSTSFAAFDWVMSLAPMWFSTMFGVYLFAGSMLAAHCVLAVAAFVFQKCGAMRDEVTVEHYHDLGKYIFGFLLFWIYISFSQYMLIWYGNIPEETEWIYRRQLGSFGVIGLILIFFHWMLPFLGTMSRYVRRRPPLVVGWAAYVLVLHYFDVYWMIMPESHAGVPGAFADPGGLVGVLASVICVLGMVGILAGLVLRVAQETRIAASSDPRFRESVVFENI